MAKAKIGKGTKPAPTVTEKGPQTAFWFCKVPQSMLEAADKKRDAVGASKKGVLFRMIEWYLQAETKP